MTAEVVHPETLLFSIDLDQFPECIFVLRDTLKRYGCYRYNGHRGLACFSTAERATQWARIEFANALMKPEEVTFDEARDIAKGRPDNLEALYLLDQDEPLIHWIA